jgi:hypothetical protein
VVETGILNPDEFTRESRKQVEKRRFWWSNFAVFGWMRWTQEWREGMTDSWRLQVHKPYITSTQAAVNYTKSSRLKDKVFHHTLLGHWYESPVKMYVRYE